MTTPNIEELRKLAEAATPGPWAFGTFHRLLVVQVDKHGYADKHSAIADIGAGSIPWDATAGSMQEYNDAEYIAAANPAAVITLLDQLQSQAERIKELEAETRHKALVIATWRDKHDTLRAQLAAIAATEPESIATDQTDEFGEVIYREVYTRPMPAQDVTELVGALQLFAYALPLDKSTVKTCYAVNNQMRDAAHAALSKYKGAK